MTLTETLAAGETRRIGVGTSGLAGSVYVVRVASGESVETRRTIGARGASGLWRVGLPRLVRRT